MSLASFPYSEYRIRIQVVDHPNAHALYERGGVAPVSLRLRKSKWPCKTAGVI